MAKPTKPVPLNKMTKKQLLRELRKVKEDRRKRLDAAWEAAAGLEQERDDFRQSLNGALEQIAALKGEVTALQKAALL